MKNLSFLLIIPYLFLSCSNFKTPNDQNDEKISIELSNRSSQLYIHNLFSKDSLNTALKLIDSALSIKKNIHFYYNKYFILRRLGEYKLALNCCDSILNLNKYEFTATLNKSFLYEDLKFKDSEILYYRKALTLVDNEKSYNAENILKDRQRIIILGLMNDTLEFKKELTDFKIKYSNTNSSNIQLYINELQNFDREKYVFSY